jgi:hypothetical protein
MAISLDRAGAPIDLVRQFVRFGICRLEDIVFGLKGGGAGTLLLGEVDSITREAAQSDGVAVGEVGRDCDHFQPSARSVSAWASASRSRACRASRDLAASRRRHPENWSRMITPPIKHGNRSKNRSVGLF